MFAITRVRLVLCRTWQGNSLYLSDVLLLLPQLEYDFIRQTAQTSDSFVVPLAGGLFASVLPSVTAGQLTGCSVPDCSLMVLCLSFEEVACLADWDNSSSSQSLLMAAIVCRHGWLGLHWR